MDRRWLSDSPPRLQPLQAAKKVGIEFNYLVRSGRAKNTARTMAAALADPGHGT
jgi:hypothetical protein